MRLAILALAFIVSTCFACEYGREEGLFKNDFTSTSSTDNFVPDDDGDANADYSHSKVVKFGTKFKIYTNTEYDSIKIFDNGVFSPFESSGAEPALTPFSTDLFTLANKPFVSALLLKEKGGVDYKFTYKHLKSSDIVTSGTQSGPSKCILQRLENIIGDCDDNYRLNTPAIDEALIATFEIHDAPKTYYFQMFLAVDVNGDTHIGFLYNDLDDIPAGLEYKSGYITGAAAAGTKNAGVCPTTTTTLSTDIHLQSNCRCGKWNKGIYVFKVTDGQECGKNKGNFDAECSKSLTLDNTENFKMACRPPRYPQDTCLELVWCRDTDTGKEVNIKVLNPPFKTNTVVSFINKVAFNNGAGMITETSVAACKKNLVQEGSTDVYGAVFLQASPSTCMWEETGDEIDFVVRLYDGNNGEFDQAGDIYLKATCDILPKDSSVNVKHEGILEHSVPAVVGRKVEMFITTQRYYPSGVGKNYILAPDAEAYLGQNLYINIAYEWGNRIVVDKIEPYGIYAYDCKVSNNKDFLTTGTNRVEQLITSAGCVDASRTAAKAFYMEESFKMALKLPINNIEFKSDDTTVDGVYNFVISTSSFDAAKWLVGASDKIYIQCTVGFCYNQVYRKNSKCWDSCGNTNIDYEATGRRRRDANETDKIPYPDVNVQTSVTIIKPTETAETKQEVECISNVVAYSILLSLTVLLLVAMGVTLLLFVRLHARQRKRK